MEDPLPAIASRLYPLVHCRLDSWRQQVRRWAANAPHYDDDPCLGTSTINEHGGKEKHDELTDRTVIQHDDRVLPLYAPLTREECIALLAAIHDTYAIIFERIDPWRDLMQLPLADGQQENMNEYQEALRYRILT